MYICIYKCMYICIWLKSNMNGEKFDIHFSNIIYQFYYKILRFILLKNLLQNIKTQK